MIPDFDIHGVLPPIFPGELGHSDARSPYLVDMLGFSQRFGTTTERREILRGLLGLREGLLAVGITDGFQWLDGSFVEDVERTRGRPPADIDVVTFAVLGDADAQRSRIRSSPNLFNPHLCKVTFRVDHYVMPTDRGLDESLGRRIAYWYSMWAHQRETNRWKGFVSVSLTSNDAEAREWLAEQDVEQGGTP